MAYIIERPYGAEDNDINRAQVKILEGWARRHGEEIEKIEISEESVGAKTKSGRDVFVRLTDGCYSRYQNVRHYMQMWEDDANGKRTRIKKAEW